MIKLDRNMSELRYIVCKIDIILVLVLLLVLLCEIYVSARTRVSFGLHLHCENDIYMCPTYVRKLVGPVAARSKAGARLL